MKQTFKRFLLEYEFHIPKTTYGYWITDNGEFIPVNNQQHAAILKKHEKFQKHIGLDRKHEAEILKIAALNLGWVRIVEWDAKQEIGVYLEFDRFTPKSFEALKKFLEDRAAIHAEKLANITIDTPEFSENAQHFSTAIKIVRRFWNEQVKKPKNINEKALLEYDLPYTEYGYWLNTKGEFLPVDKQKHLEAARKFVPQELQLLYPFITPYEVALKIGWVRLYEITFSSGTTQIGIEFQKLKPSTLAALRFYLGQLKDKYFGRETSVRISFSRTTETFDTIGRAIAGLARYQV